jgi:hypothetical protein
VLIFMGRALLRRNNVPSRYQWIDRQNRKIQSTPRTWQSLPDLPRSVALAATRSKLDAGNLLSLVFG